MSRYGIKKTNNTNMKQGLIKPKYIWIKKCFWYKNTPRVNQGLTKQINLIPSNIIVDHFWNLFAEITE